MPRAARFRISAIEDLFRQLRFAPASTRRREMDAAERLLREIDPDGIYPADFVTFRVTGYRPEPDEAPVTLVGAALRGDLVNFIQRLSDGLDLPRDYGGRRALGLDEVVRRLQVSTKTLQRYRQQGLVLHYVRFDDGATRLACFEDALEWFTGTHRGQVTRAAAFSRLDDADETRLIADARRLREDEGLSLNEVALRLAPVYGRAHETIRGRLRRHDRRASRDGAPIFAEPGPLDERDVRLAHRVWGRGLSAAALGRRLGRRPAMIRRAVLRRRADRLEALDLRWVSLPTFDLPEAEPVILAAPPVMTPGPDPLPVDDALALVAAAAGGAVVTETEEHALVAGYNLLKRRAGTGIAGLPRWPGAAAIDRIETDLRWAAALHRRLVVHGLPCAVQRIEQNLHQPLPVQPAHRIVELLELGRRVIAAVVDALEPHRGQRLVRLATWGIDRALAVTSIDDAVSRRAAVRHPEGGIPLRGFLDGLASWDATLRLRLDLAPLVTRLEPSRAELVSDHYGLAGIAPRTVAEIAATRGIAAAAVNRQIRRALRELRAMSREPTASRTGNEPGPPAGRTSSARRDAGRA